MMIKKPFGKKVLSIILVIVIAVTPFSYVKADTYTMDDVYYKLRDILTVLNGYGQNIPTEGINDQIQDLQDLFDTIFVDNTYSYVGVTGTVEYRTFMDLMQVIASMGYTIPSHIMEGYYMRDQNGILVHMAGVNENIAAVLNKLNQLNSSSSTIISDLQSIISQTASILTTLNTVSSTLTNILTVDSNILNLETNFYNYIQNGTFKQDLDNAIDKITWLNASNISGLAFGSSFDKSDLTPDTQTSVQSFYVKYFGNMYLQSKPAILKIVLPFSRNNNLTSSNYDSISVDLINGSGNVLVRNYDYYVSLADRSITIFLYNFSSYPKFHSIRVNSNFLWFYFNTSTYYVQYIDYEDIEYWELLSYFDLHRLLLDYESVNSSELDKLKQENQQFNTTLQNFNNLETQISTDFSNNLVTFNSNLTESTTMFNSLTNTVVWFSNQMQNIFNVSSDFKMLLIMPMVLGIALWFIGRGSFILRSSGKKGKENNKS